MHPSNHLKPTRVHQSAQPEGFIPPTHIDEYKLLRELGRGSVGSVWLAHDRHLSRPVAIKVLAEERPGPEAQWRFQIEAAAIARLRHPNIIQVYRCGQFAGRRYVVYELLDGHGLDTLTLPLSDAQVIRVATDLARGLSAAHENGVLHRDIKLSNAYWTANGVAKLIDFGLAKITEPIDGIPRALTRPGDILGTPRYIAPELWIGRPASVATDLYAFGVMLYQLVTGRPPHAARNMRELVANICERDVPMLGDIDWRLANIIDRCLKRDPSQRLRSAGVLRDAFELLADPR